ncbi:hypothetical protein PsYK624_088430 [Phanerochaete sordida]|uniref:Cytochrome P450 n=1 Tax=Phanerochaete sordida TaxID=48140 RepID=A0A9P3GAX5_9APHY|nr:hypothetical protein PsYK624_088430 [Phanerochaete sordida]
MPGYLNECFHLYGPNFQLNIAGTAVVFVSDHDSLDTFYRNKDGSLTNDILITASPPRLLGGVKAPDSAYIIETSLIPIIVKGNMEPSLCEIGEAFNRELCNQFAQLLVDQSPSRPQPLRQLITYTLFHSIVPAVFGSDFPLSIYDDLMALDISTYHLFHSIPLFSNSVPHARLRVRGAVLDFMRSWKDSTTPHADYAISEHGNEVLHKLFALDLTDEDRAGLLQVYIWGLITNVFRMTYWLIAHLVCDRADYMRMQEEIDAGVAHEFPDRPSLLSAHPRAVNSTRFALLDSGMKETGRLYFYPFSRRIATADVEFRSASGPFMVSKGSQVIAYNTGAHHNPDNFEDPKRFLLDRFVGGKNARNLYLWARGSHICPGRHMAIYYLKMFTILLFQQYELAAAEGEAQPVRLPEGNPWSAGMPLPRKDVLVTLRKRV